MTRSARDIPARVRTGFSRFLPLVVLIGLAFWLLTPPLHAETLGEMLDGIYAEGGYQDELPATYEPEAGRTGDPREPSVLPAGVMTMVFYVVLAAFALFTVVVIVMLLLGVRLPALQRPGAEEITTDGVSQVRTPGTTSDWLTAADALARNARYGEAIHSLLLAVLSKLRERAGTTWHNSRTAREIVVQANLAIEQTGLLGNLVRTAELAHFGGRPSNEAEFEQCREDAVRLIENTPGGRP